ncbi:Putative membrane protein [Durusdinium trenchii]|uniref:Membrane protein n=1 Tax=Durusdinium trenchii TaxID=1381693 RepID=A0ABP0M2G0_9DINO
MVSYYAKFSLASVEEFENVGTAGSDCERNPDGLQAVRPASQSVLPTSSAAQPQTSAVSYYGSLAGRGLNRAGVALAAADVAVRNGQAGLHALQRRQALGSLNAARTVEELQSVLSVRLSELDAFSCTVALHRLARLSHDVDKHTPQGKGMPQRQQHFLRERQSSKVREHPSWPILLRRLNGEALNEAEPRQLANMAWAIARLRAQQDGMHLLHSAVLRCAERSGPGQWDAMSTSLIPWSFATLSADARRVPELQRLVASVDTSLRNDGSSFWTPGDLSRIAWSWAKLVQKDEAFFRRCSCLVIARLPEYTPSQLAQTIWAFATAAPQDACSHFFPKAAAAMTGDDGRHETAVALQGYTPQHLAMAVWSFAAVLYRPEELLKQIGDVVPKLTQLNPQDISTTAWAFTTLLAKDRTIYDALASTSIRTIHEFNNQDLSNTVWAFASAGEHNEDLLEAAAAETCRRDDFHGQHLAMVAWAFITLRHRHDKLLHFIGRITNGPRGLGTWSNAKLLAFTFAGLPRLGDALLGTPAWTLGAMQRLLDQFHSRLQAGTGDVDSDDAWVVHDAILPWLQLPGGSELRSTPGWQALSGMLWAQQRSLHGFLSTAEEFQSILSSEKPKETPTIRRYQESLQSFRVRGLGCEHSWRLLSDIGVRRAEWTEDLGGTAARSCALKQVNSDGRGERQNWCFFRAYVKTKGLVAHEPGRWLNSTVVKYCEDCAGLVHVKLHHDRVDHRAWDAEFRAMARTAAAARTLLHAEGDAHAQEIAQNLLANGARPDGLSESVPCGASRDAEALVEGYLALFMTEVPCLSCMCAMAQFRKRFSSVSLQVSWEGLPLDKHFDPFDPKPRPPADIGANHEKQTKAALTLDQRSVLHFAAEAGSAVATAVLLGGATKEPGPWA